MARQAIVQMKSRGCMKGDVIISSGRRMRKVRRCVKPMVQIWAPDLAKSRFRAGLRVLSEDPWIAVPMAISGGISIPPELLLPFFSKAFALIMPNDSAIFVLYSILREASRGIEIEPLPLTLLQLRN